MKAKFVRRLLYAAIVVLYLLHNDLWLWDDARRIMGMPVGLFYHVMFCMAASLLMILVVNYGWPKHLKVDDEEEGAKS